MLKSKGYVTASADSMVIGPDSAKIVLFTGEKYLWATLDVSRIDPMLLQKVGWNQKYFISTPMDFNELASWQNNLLNHLENNGYPFARISLDSLRISGDSVSANLLISKGVEYKVDSLFITGNAKISTAYLQRYLDISNGSLYNKDKLLRVSSKLKELTYVEEEQPANVSMLATGAILNIYLKQKKSSQVNLLVGFLPNNDQLSSKKLLLTGEANILLRNALGSGETIGLNWQQLQVRSPRLNFAFQYPYLFKSPIGLDFAFDILRKDSSFVNINLQLGAQYALNANQSGKLFIQRFQTYISTGGINQSAVIQSRRLPNVADVSSLNVGLDYELNATDYRLNPRKGIELRVITAIGTKELKRNNEILNLKDPSNPSFDFGSLYDTIKLKSVQLRLRAIASKYLPLGLRSTLKTAVNAGFFQSPNIFRNELFQIGGYRLLRGFDEESQYLSQFAIGTVEYRYLVGQNSFFYVLADGGWGRNSSIEIPVNYTYFGTGLGLAFETKAGIFNLAWAVGKRNDTEFNLRQSKIHFGFVNYF